MAPLPPSLLSLLPRSPHAIIIPDLALSSLELDDGPALSPTHMHGLHRRQTPASSPAYGAGTPARDLNNKGFLALFALIGAGMVISSIWFFFWARNGGFRWRKGDWDDYKSTVLRRKGPDGRTLSNATKSTRLGGGSIVAGRSDAYTDETASSYDDAKEMSEVRGGTRGGRGARGGGERDRRARRHDPELREYRHEKPARVGGLNRQADGSHFDYTNTDRSEADSAAPQPPPPPPSGRDKKREEQERSRRERERKAARKRDAKDAAAAAKRSGKAHATPPPQQQQQPAKDAPTKTRRPTSRTPSPTKPLPGARDPRPYRHSAPVAGAPSTARTAPPSDAPTDPSAPSYYAAYRPRARSAPRHGAPLAADGDTGTKAYACHIPGLRRGDAVAPGDSVSQVGAAAAGRARGREGRAGRDVMQGFRRGRGRGDSLSDSGGE